MCAPFNIYALLLVYITWTQLTTSWVEDRQFAYVKSSNSYSSYPPSLFLLFLIGYLLNSTTLSQDQQSQF
jgi:hypothetical protein